MAPSVGARPGDIDARRAPAGHRPGIADHDRCDRRPARSCPLGHASIGRPGQHHLAHGRDQRPPTVAGSVITASRHPRGDIARGPPSTTVRPQRRLTTAAPEAAPRPLPRERRDDRQLATGRATGIHPVAVGHAAIRSSSPLLAPYTARRHADHSDGRRRPAVRCDGSDRRYVVGSPCCRRCHRQRRPIGIGPAAAATS